MSAPAPVVVESCADAEPSRRQSLSRRARRASGARVRASIAATHPHVHVRGDVAPRARRVARVREHRAHAAK